MTGSRFLISRLNDLLAFSDSSPSLPELVFPATREMRCHVLLGANGILLRRSALMAGREGLPGRPVVSHCPY